MTKEGLPCGVRIVAGIGFEAERPADRRVAGRKGVRDGRRVDFSTLESGAIDHDPSDQGPAPDRGGIAGPAQDLDQATPVRSHGPLRSLAHRRRTRPCTGEVRRDRQSQTTGRHVAESAPVRAGHRIAPSSRERGDDDRTGLTRG